jgi:TrmH family RNA methyltransferase
VIAVIDIPEVNVDFIEVARSLCIGLYHIQDPGNLGTIIRTADWFGIRNIFCSPGCADIYNPKVIQASMGAILNVKIHYTDFHELLGRLSGIQNFTIIGTYMQGVPIRQVTTIRTGILLFGNESRGISDEYRHFINRQVTIPPVNAARIHVESLNVASSVAIMLATMTNGD